MTADVRVRPLHEVVVAGERPVSSTGGGHRQTLTERLRHHVRVRRGGAIVVLVTAAVLAAGCTGSSSGHSSSTVPSSAPPSSTPSSATPLSTSPTSTAPASPTVPADVPTTGPNIKPGERPPVMPIVATQHTAAGARAFAEFFIRTIDWAYATTSTTYMRHYFEQTCVACRSAADAVDKVATNKHHFIGERFTVLRSSLAVAHGLGWISTVIFDVAAGEVVDAHGKFVSGEGALTNFQEQIFLATRRTGWRITDMIPKASP